MDTLAICSRELRAAQTVPREFIWGPFSLSPAASHQFSLALPRTIVSHSGHRRRAWLKQSTPELNSSRDVLSLAPIYSTDRRPPGFLRYFRLELPPTLSSIHRNVHPREFLKFTSRFRPDGLLVARRFRSFGHRCCSPRGQHLDSHRKRIARHYHLRSKYLAPIFPVPQRQEG